VSVHVGFVVDEVALGQVSPPVFWFSLVSFIPSELYYTANDEKLITFNVGLHNKPQCCGTSHPPMRKSCNLISIVPANRAAEPDNVFG
jgi:hypothetical protein